MAPVECTPGLKGGGCSRLYKILHSMKGDGQDTGRYTPFLAGSRKLDL